jgi:regulator of protease activity HflC (stomatin/prohibitin superfamily)
MKSRRCIKLPFSLAPIVPASGRIVSSALLARAARGGGRWRVRGGWRVSGSGQGGITRQRASLLPSALPGEAIGQEKPMDIGDRRLTHVVENHEAGLLYVEGRLVERLAPGRHAFWTVGRKIEVKRLDLRPQAVEITAQEMLTKDRIALRVTLTAFRRIVDPARVVNAVPDVDAWLYRLVQFAIREAVASRTLDEVLSAKNALDAELRAFVRERIEQTGIEVTELGVKDVILPGEIRELVNKVVEAERTAKANLIRRQEETAATRSLLNTAKLMEENPLLLRLKELESLERLVEKVGRIDLHAGEGAGLDALLSKLVRMKADEPRERA